MRPGEMLGLEWRRVDLEMDLIYLEGQHQKNGKLGSVPLNSHAHEAIMSRARFRAEHCPGSPWVFCDKNGRRIASVKRS
jgi:integrase